MWCGQKRTDLCSLPHIHEYNGIIVPTHSPIRACEEHRDLVHEYLLELAARSGLNLTLRLIGLALVVGGGVADHLAIAMAGAVLLGVQLIVFPYATPETVRRLGVVQAKWLARYLGILMAAVFGAVLGHSLLVR
jgi:hypothetical protein